jgi:mRNA interferase RelE/StbE
MHPSLKKKINSSLKIVLSDPYSGKAVMDELAGLRSFKVSSFRIIYRIKDPKQIELVTIGPRERIYEETLRIIQKEEGRYRRIGGRGDIFNCGIRISECGTEKKTWR